MIKKPESTNPDAQYTTDGLTHRVKRIRRVPPPVPYLAKGARNTESNVVTVVEIAERLADFYRRQRDTPRGKSIARISRATGISQPTLHSYLTEREKRVRSSRSSYPSADRMDIIMAALGVNVRDLLYRKETTPLTYQSADDMAMDRLRVFVKLKLAMMEKYCSDILTRINAATSEPHLTYLRGKIGAVLLELDALYAKFRIVRMEEVDEEKVENNTCNEESGSV